MKKILTAFLSAVITMTSVALTSSAQGDVSAKVKRNGEYQSITAVSATSSKGVDWHNEIYAAMDKDDYLLYEGIKLYADIKSVTIKAASYYGGHSDGDFYLFRVGGPTGDVIGECHIGDTDGLENIQEFTGSINVPSDGMYDLYVTAYYGRHSSYTGVPYVTIMESFKFSDEPAVAEAEGYVPATDFRDSKYDTWYAVDDAGRALPDYEGVGGVRNDRFVGIFYWDWHEQEGALLSAYDKTELVKEHPEIIHDYSSPLWPRNSANFWSEPLFGYYRSTDRWVIRKHAQMLANAGVDVIFLDCTNGDYTYERSYMAIFDEFANARKNGIKTPQIAFMTSFAANLNSKVAITKLYKTLYQQNKYSDLWFMWEGKPLLLGQYSQFDDEPLGDVYTTALYREMKEFFTYRAVQSDYNTGQTMTNQWGWLEKYPQHKYNTDDNGVVEEMAVGIALNQNYATSKLTAMNDSYAKGRSYTEKYGIDFSENAENYGDFFKEQWEYALKADPEFIFITGWNEWIANRYATWEGVANAFPDTFNPMYSRDIEPVKGKFGDNYYYQMVDYIRRYKGVRPVETASEQKTIDIDGSLSQWQSVGPEFINDKGMTMHRDTDGYKGFHYTNTTGRNDIVSSKVARDSDYIYFYAEAADTLTSPEDEKWMRLYLNTDRDHGTGWEGYDYILNRTSPSEKATLEKNMNNAWEWKTAGEVDFKVDDNVLIVRIPRTVLGIDNKIIDIEFKWADNTATDGDTIDFWVSGSAAPCGKYNYRYTEKAMQLLSDSDVSALEGVTVIKAGNPYIYKNGYKDIVYGGDNNITPINFDGNLYIPRMLAEKILDGSKIQWSEARKYLTIKTTDKTWRIYSDGTNRIDGVVADINETYKEFNGTQYIRLNLFADIYGLSVKEYANGAVVIGSASVADSVVSNVNEKLKEEVSK